MTRNFALAMVSFALAASAFAQPPSAGVDWSQSVTGVDGPSTQQIDVIAIISDLTGKPASAITEDDLVRYWEQHQAIYSSRPQPAWMLNPPVVVTADMFTADDTPLPPPCEPPLPRSPPQQPGPPAPAPCPAQPR